VKRGGKKSYRSVYGYWVEGSRPNFKWSSSNGPEGRKKVEVAGRKFTGTCIVYNSDGYNVWVFNNPNPKHRPSNSNKRDWEVGWKNLDDYPTEIVMGRRRNDSDPECYCVDCEKVEYTSGRKRN